MKIPRIVSLTLCALALAAAAAACAPSSTSQAEYIGLDAAKAIALEAAGVTESQADFTTTGLDRRGNTDFYAVDFTANGQSYEYDIDAITGVIISGPAGTPGTAEPAADPSAAVTTTPVPVTPSPTQSGTSSGLIGEDRAREIALAHAGLSAGQVTFLKSNLDYDDGRQVYDIEFYTTDYTEYDYEIDALTGEIRSFDSDAEGYTPPTPGTTVITADQAKQAALARVPGATVNDIYDFELDRDDGRLEYEGTIYYNGMEYDFTIDGYSGAIRSWEADPIWD